ncbi:MAG TPA: hypothetical protein VHC63_18855 [Acidimicrobiales bacterium]|nr:hypothetical protein [Acidimicrobiales bacterium]
MAKTCRPPTEQDAAEAKRVVLEGLARGDDVPGLATQLAPLHPKNNTFPGEVLLNLGADAIDLAGASRDEPLAYEGVRERFLPECEFFGRDDRKLRYALLAVAAVRGGVELDLLDEVIWWQTDDLWYYALCACVAWIRAAADRAGLSIKIACERLAADDGIDLGA